MTKFWLLSCVFVCLGCGDDSAAFDAGESMDGGLDSTVLDAEADSTIDAEVMDARPDSPDADISGLPSYPLEAQYPEGGIYDPAGRFFVGSLGDGSVHSVDAATGEESIFFSPTESGTWWTLGMDIDSEARRLFVCAMEDRREITDEEPPFDGYVWVFDLDTAERIAVHDLGETSSDATCTDVVVAEDDTLYVCDRENPRIYQIDPSGEQSVLVENDVLDGAVVGQNALVVLPDQSGLLSLVYLPSKLVYVGLGATAGQIRRVDIDGDFLDGLPALSGADGMMWDDGSVWVAFTSQLTRVTPILGDWSTAEANAVDVPAGMTDVIRTPDGPYLLNGQAVRFALGQDPDPFAIVRFEGTL